MKNPKVEDYDLQPYNYINAIQKYTEYLEFKLKKQEQELNIQNVSNQRELLIDFVYSLGSNDIANGDLNGIVDDYLDN